MNFQGDVETELKKADSIYSNLCQQLSEANAIINVLQKLCEVQIITKEQLKEKYIYIYIYTVYINSFCQV